MLHVSQALLHTVDRSHVNLFFHLPLQCLCCIAPHSDSRKPVALVSVFLWSCLLVCTRRGLKASFPFNPLICAGTMAKGYQHVRRREATLMRNMREDRRLIVATYAACDSSWSRKSGRAAPAPIRIQIGAAPAAVAKGCSGMLYQTARGPALCSTPRKTQCQRLQES